MNNLPLDLSNSIYIAGHTGLIGSAFMRRLANDGYHHVITRSRSEFDLTDASAVESFFQRERPRFVVLAAGRVGGITDNKTYPADYIMENLAMELNVIRSAHRAGVHRLLFFGSSCMYPRECSQPMHENQLLTGKPEPTSIAYAMAKLAGDTCMKDGKPNAVCRIRFQVYRLMKSMEPRVQRGLLVARLQVRAVVDLCYFLFHRKNKKMCVSDCLN